MRGCIADPPKAGRVPAIVVVAALSFAACRAKQAPAPASAPSTSTSASTLASVSSSASAVASSSLPPSLPDPLASVSWQALVAAEAWPHAARAIDALPADVRATFPARLARLRVSTGLCTEEEGARGAEEAAKLRDDPAAAKLVDLVRALEVDALLCANKPREALAITGPGALATRRGPLAAWTRARALEASGDLSGARVAVTEAIDAGASSGLPTGKLVAFRLALLRKLPATVDVTRAIEADRKRLFVEFPTSFDAAGKQGEPQTAPTLDAAAWLQRADALASLGRAEDALHAIDAAKSAGANARKVTRARAHALWKAKSWARAAPLLKEAAALGNDEDAFEDAFLAARATSRSGDDTAAIAAYEALAKAHPTSRWGAEAAYLAANLRWLAGHWKDALLALDKYLAGPWAKEKHQENNLREAKRARAIALLESGANAAARASLNALAESDAFAHDGYARARLELLSAIAVERAGNRAPAIAAYSSLSAKWPLTWIDLAARARLARLGEPRAAFPTGPIAPPSPPALAEEIRLLDGAGLHRDALARFLSRAEAANDSARCSTFDLLDAGWDAYRAGLRLDVDGHDAADQSWRWHCVYPTPWEPVVSALEAREGLPRGLLHAIIRQESAFRVEVVSPAGAVGVAQLMPQTAVMTAAPLGMTLDPTDIAALEAPFLQLDLAARHLHSLFVELAGEAAPAERAADAVPLVIAAYNGGAGSVKRWMKEAGSLDADVFVERIPYVETRGYVARVLGNLVRYSIMAGAKTPSLPQKFPAPP